jgi:RND family efflux transporter MFP subunit
VIVSERIVTLVAPLDGIVESVRVRVGDVVHRGDILAALDTRAKKRELAIVKASLRSAEAEVEKSSVEVAQARDARARREALHAQGLASGEDLAKASYQARLAESQIEIAAARAEETRARVTQLRGAIDDAELRAPFDSRVAARFVDPGATVLHGAPLVRLLSQGELKVRFAVTAAAAAELAPGVLVRAEITRANIAFEGSIDTIAPEVDAATRLVLVEARLRAEDTEKLRSLTGEVVRVELPGAGD